MSILNSPLSATTSRRIRLAAGAALLCLSAPLATPAASEPPHCKGLVLDRSHAATLRLMSTEGPARDVTLQGTDKSESLNHIVVIDCDPDYYVVQYNNKSYSIDRTDVVDGKYITCVTPANSKRPVDKQTRGGNAAFPDCP